MSDVAARLLPIAKRVALLLAITSALAATANAVSPRRIAWVADRRSPVAEKAAAASIGIVTLEQTMHLLNQGEYIVLDARSRVAFEMGHIPGAIVAPVEHIEQTLEELAPLIAPDQPMLVYCSGESCDQSLQLAQAIKSQGVKNVVVFAGGMNAWQKAALEIEPGL